MANADTFSGDVTVRGAFAATGTFSAPASSITNTMIQTAAGIDASKVIHRQDWGTELYGPTTSVAALTKVLGMAYAACTVVQFGCWIEVVASGADRTITVDLKKSTGAGAYATILSATVGFTNGSAVRTLVLGTLSSTSLVAGDILEAVVTVAGAAGAQATGLSCSLQVNANPA